MLNQKTVLATAILLSSIACWTTDANAAVTGPMNMADLRADSSDATIGLVGTVTAAFPPPSYTAVTVPPVSTAETAKGPQDIAALKFTESGFGKICIKPTNGTGDDAIFVNTTAASSGGVKVGTNEWACGATTDQTVFAIMQTPANATAHSTTATLAYNVYHR
ncbi:hypothetical protein CWK15_14015 [Salmonella enterica]|uniref:Fimbrial protein n=1 Tax=Salmonella enterica TaxID=28901 RepID=A0A5V4Z4H9_SALER|nr:hypothetical protein [Salmonella enterica]EIU1711114.1 hypothetical protein [Salmonella enterica]